MASLPQATKVTYEEWLRMPVVEDAIEEVVNGEIRVILPNRLPHARITQRLTNALVRQLDETRVPALNSDFGLIIHKAPLTSRVPDVAVFELATMVEEDGYVHSAPQLAVEVLSPANTRRERTEKLTDYASIGIPEVWIISPQAQTVEVLFLEDSRYRRSAILAEGVLKPARFPDVQINIAEIWPD